MSVADDVIEQLSFDENGLVPAIAQQFNSGEILMFAWVNRDAIRATLNEGRAVYFSRSRNKLWRKGEESGQIQQLVEFRWDCDSDCVLLQVDQTGVACHTGRRSCFFNAVRNGKIETIAEVEIDPERLYRR